MVTLSPSASGPVCVTGNYTSSVRSSPLTAEPGRLKDVKTERRRRCDGVYGTFHHDDPNFLRER